MTIVQTCIASLILFLLALNAPLDVLAAPKDAPLTKSGSEHTTELWEGKVLTAKFRAGMCFAHDGGARGVLLLTHANGQTDTYHLYGSIHNNEFNLSHGSGHTFKGRITGRDTMEGKVKLKSGMGLTLKGSRQINVPLLAEDCAPLPK